MNRPPLHAKDIAAYFLAKVDEESGDFLTHLKLQKLLYYAQGLFLAHQGEPLFGERIEAWELGPVVSEIYREYKHFGSQVIEPDHRDDTIQFAPEVLEILHAVHRVYGQFAAWKLSELTHGEPPWRETPRNREITPASLRTYFRRVLEAGQIGEAVEGGPVWPTQSFLHQRRREIMKSAPRRERLRAILDCVPSPDLWIR